MQLEQERLVLLAGFGGQGILFAGKFMAYAGLMSGLEVSWLPSYGPEMRGGTAHCSVTLSKYAIGSPLITKPSDLIVMNQPSWQKFESSIQSGGFALIDASLVDPVTKRDDISVCALPASNLAEEAGITKLANVICLGALQACKPFCEDSLIDEVIKAIVPAHKLELIDLNKRAFELGYEYAQKHA